jgi:hypothetical protein
MEEKLDLCKRDGGQEGKFDRWEQMNLELASAEKNLIHCSNEIEEN